MERRLLSAALQDREVYEQLQRTECDDSLTDQAKLVWNEIKQFYEADAEAEFVDKDTIKHRLEKKYPKHSELFSSFINSLETVSSVNVLIDALDLKKEAIAQELSLAFATKDWTKIDPLLEKYNKYTAAEDACTINEIGEVYQGFDIDSLVVRTNPDNRIKLLPASLNSQCDGGALRGHHLVVFAPTDMGKTLWGINWAYGFVTNNLKVLYGGNEDPAQDIIMRFLTRLTGMDKYAIRKDPKTAGKIAFERGYNNFIMAELCPGTPDECRRLIDTYEPDVFICDQIRNLNMGESNRVLQLEKAATMMRNFGKEYNLVPVSLTQAADSATNKLILDRGDIDFSNVGIPGTADLLIGIGANQDFEAQGFRMVSFVKNKLSGIKTPLKVKFDHKLSRVESL